MTESQLSILYVNLLLRSSRLLVNLPTQNHQSHSSYLVAKPPDSLLIWIRIHPHSHFLIMSNSVLSLLDFPNPRTRKNEILVLRLLYRRRSENMNRSLNCRIFEVLLLIIILIYITLFTLSLQQRAAILSRSTCKINLILLIVFNTDYWPVVRQDQTACSLSLFKFVWAHQHLRLLLKWKFDNRRKRMKIFPHEP